MTSTEPTPGSTTYWQQLANAASEGSLHLAPDTAKLCDAACTQYLMKLEAHVRSAVRLADVTGLGDFESGKQLARIFSERAVGGPNNMVDVIDGHIRVVKDMQAVFRKFFTHYDETDGANASEIAQTGPN